ncbi:DUF2231 domain-containing protein [Saccharomonospora saliphila]|uniref:DUF2231 domain-containing protein n=1 Tax=Saccharomonospora saliphila TaxID=369829 RepID=UPI00036C5256|nr:DUF2231 domain-containing protein [Saccharomonospora saliphila]
MLDRLLRSSESVPGLDRATETLARRLRRALDGRRIDALLRGSWIGHPVHPLVVTVPIGAWSCVTLFDVLGDREAARRLVAVGATVTPVAIVTGLAEFSRLDRTQRRVAALHLATNAVAQTCYVTSHRNRARGAHAAGVTWALLGLTAVAAGGALGGHLSYALGAGVYEWQRGPRDRP